MKRLEQPSTETVDQACRSAELVLRVLQGETDAFRPLVEMFEPAVFGLCRRLASGNATEAEDLTQETFVQAFRYLPTLENRERFAPWLYQIARSLCRSRRRRRQLEHRVLRERAELLQQQAGSRRNGSWLPASATSSGPGGRSWNEEGYDDAEGPDQVAAALADLPADEREVLNLRYFEGLSYEAIAARLSLTFSQVDHLIRRARARLARRIGVRRHRERTL